MTSTMPPVALTEWVPLWLDRQPTDDELTYFAPQRSAAEKIQAFETMFGSLERARPRTQWASLLQIATVDLGAARTIEPHLDALTLRSEAGLPPAEGSSFWGVYAAEASGKRLIADASSGVVTGEKPWCSLAGELTHAIVTAWVGEQRQAFAIALDHPSVTVVDQPWHSTGLAEIPSGPIRCDATPATPVGEFNWYLQRPGFWWGAIRVAACWLGGAIGMARFAADRHVTRPQPEPHRNAVLGQVDALIYAGLTALDHAATRSESTTEQTVEEVRKLALRVRNTIYRTCQQIQQLARELAGPELLTGHRAFNKADADLTVYVSQHHGVRDEADLGRLLVEEVGP